MTRTEQDSSLLNTGAAMVGNVWDFATTVIMPASKKLGDTSRAETAIRTATFARKPKWTSDSILPGHLRTEYEELDE